jgi:fatty aldehyde decarbonylase
MSAAPFAPASAAPTPVPSRPDYGSASYGDAFSRINALVIVGEAMADRHFRRLAALLPQDREELCRLGAMEGRHAADFVGCGRHLGVTPDLALARRLLAPLRQQFDACESEGDVVGCLTLQCLIIESFAVAAYRCYLPVADLYAAPITAAVLQDEDAHLGYGEQWLGQRLEAVREPLERCCRQAVPAALSLLQGLQADLEAIAIAPLELIATFVACFQEALEAIGYTPQQARVLVARLTGAALA